MSSQSNMPNDNPEAAAFSLLLSVNDKPHRIASTATLLQLLDELALASTKGVAVAINDAVVSRLHWPLQRLTDGDRVLIIQATQGG